MKRRSTIAILLVLVLLMCAIGFSEEINEQTLDAIVDELGEQELSDGGSLEMENDAGLDDNNLDLSVADDTDSSETPLFIEEEAKSLSTMNALDAPTPQTIDWTITGSDKKTVNIGDTLRITVSNGEVLSWKTGSKKIVPSVTISDGVAEVKPIAKGKVKLTASIKIGKKKKSYAVNLTVNDPYIPQKISFTEDMRTSVPVGTTIRLSDYIILQPSYARNNLTYKVSGAAKLAKDGVTLNATKAGKATIIVTSIAIFKNLTNTSKSETNADNQKE